MGILPVSLRLNDRRTEKRPPVASDCQQQGRPQHAANTQHASVTAPGLAASNALGARRAASAANLVIIFIEILHNSQTDKWLQLWRTRGGGGSGRKGAPDISGSRKATGEIATGLAEHGGATGIRAAAQWRSHASTAAPQLESTSEQHSAHGTMDMSKRAAAPSAAATFGPRTAEK